MLMQLFLDPENLSASFNCVNNQLKKVRSLHFIYKQQYDSTEETTCNLSNLRSLNCIQFTYDTLDE